MCSTILVALLGLHSCDSGRLSVYAPGDGHNRGLLACGGEFTKRQEHVAYRRWWKVGCGREVLVCAEATGRCALTTVRDGGPYGVYQGRLRNRRTATPAERRAGAPREGWQWRGAADLSYKLWIRLGRPPFLSGVQLFFFKRTPRGGSRRISWVSLAGPTRKT